MTARQFTHEELEHLTNYWCKTLGIHSKDLLKHPYIDDVILLIKFIKEYQTEFKAKHRLSVYLLWDLCYKKRKPLQKKHLNQILGIGERLNYVRNIKNNHIKEVRQKIKATRRTMPA
jgi:hypothetical protein